MSKMSASKIRKHQEFLAAKSEVASEIADIMASLPADLQARIRAAVEERIYFEDLTQLVKTYEDAQNFDKRVEEGECLVFDAGEYRIVAVF